MSRRPPETLDLPTDVLEDLRDAFNFYAKDDFVSVAHFKNIIHNHGFHNMSKKEMDEELRTHQIN